LLAARHETLARLFRFWDERRGPAHAPPAVEVTAAQLAELAAATARIERAASPVAPLVVVESGAGVDCIYGDRLTGANAVRLTPGRGDGEAEAGTVFQTGRPLLVEDRIGPQRTGARVARLYLPLADASGAVSAVLCGVVTIG